MLLGFVHSKMFTNKEDLFSNGNGFKTVLTD